MQTMQATQVEKPMNKFVDQVVLKSIDVTGEVCDMFGHINTKAIYYNGYTVPIEVNYKFCLEPNAVVDSLKVTIADRVIYGHVEEKKQAQKTYTKAIKENKRASILEKHQDRYCLTLGNIQPSETIIISYTYLTRLELLNGKYLFVCPTNVGERYGMTVIGSENDTDSLDDHTANEHVKTTAKMQTTSEKPPVYFSITCVSKGQILSTTSTTSDIDVEVVSPNEVVVRSLSCPLDGDFNFLIETGITSCAYSGVLNNIQYHMLTHKIPDENNVYVPKEYIFLLDRSGSMSGSKIHDATSALISSLDLLKPDSYFNIMSFGSDYSAMFSNSVITSKENITKAKMLLQTYSANMGGTEIYGCLGALFTNSIKKFTNSVTTLTIPANCERVVVFLTDGQIDNLDSVYSLINNNNKNSNIRIFSIGIGNDASRELIKKIADITSGISQMVVDSANISEVAKSMIVNTEKKYYKNIKLNCNEVETKYFGSSRVYPGQVLASFFTTEFDPKNANNNLTLTGFDQTMNKTTSWNVDTSETILIHPLLLAKFYANEMIKDGNLTNKEIVDLSVQNNIMNNLTSFVLTDTEVTESDHNNMINVSVENRANLVQYHCGKYIDSGAYMPDLYDNQEHDKGDLVDSSLDTRLKNKKTSHIISTVSSDSDEDFSSFPTSYSSYGGAAGCALAGCAPTTSYVEQRLEEVDALEGGLDMFGGSGGGSRTVCNYELLKFTNTDGSVNLDKIKLFAVKSLQDVTNFATDNNVSLDILLQIIALMHFELMQQVDKNKVTFLKNWLSKNYPAYTSLRPIITHLVKSPISVEYYGGGGDY